MEEYIIKIKSTENGGMQIETPAVEFSMESSAVDLTAGFFAFLAEDMNRACAEDLNKYKREVFNAMLLTTLGAENDD